MESAITPIVLFAAAGVYDISFRLRRPAFQLAAVLAVLYLAGTFHVPGTPKPGFSAIAARLSAPDSIPAPVILADGDPMAEGMAVSEIAIRDHRPARYVIRASKLLANSTWTGRQYRALQRTPDEVLQALDSTGVSVVIIQTKPLYEVRHHELLKEGLASAPDTWQPWSDPAWSRDLLVYRRVHPITSRSCFEISLESTLHVRLPVCTKVEP